MKLTFFKKGKFMGLVKASNGVFYYRFRQQNGKYSMRSLGTKDETEAQQKYNEFKLTTNIIENDGKKHLKVSELYKRFSDYYIKSGKSVKLLYPLAKFQTYVSDKACDKISRYDTNMYALHLSNSKRLAYRGKKIGTVETEKILSPTSVSIEIRFLRSLFQKAVNWNLIIHNPFKNIRLPKQPKDFKKKTVTESEIFLIINSCINERNYNIGKKCFEIRENKTMKNLIMIAYISGMRLGEICNLQWNNINFPERTISIRNRTNTATNQIEWRTKTVTSERDLPMNQTLFEIFSEQYKLNGAGKFVFSNIDKSGNEQPFSKNRVNHFFKRKVRECKLDENLHFHCLRHTAITNLFKQNIPVAKIQIIMGHSDLKTTMLYSHMDVSDLKEAMQQVNLSIPKS
jgi:integrase